MSIKKKSSDPTRRTGMNLNFIGGTGSGRFILGAGSGMAREAAVLIFDKRCERLRWGIIDPTEDRVCQDFIGNAKASQQFSGNNEEQNNAKKARNVRQPIDIVLFAVLD